MFTHLCPNCGGYFDSEQPHARYCPEPERQRARQAVNTRRYLDDPEHRARHNAACKRWHMRRAYNEIMCGARYDKTNYNAVTPKRVTWRMGR